MVLDSIPCFARMKSSGWINTLTPYHGGNMMNAWRKAYAMHYINAFYRHASQKDHLFLLTNIRASWFICSHNHSALCMHLRRRCGPSNFPWQNDKTNATHEWWCNTYIHTCEHAVDSIEQKYTRGTSMVTPSNNNTVEMHTDMAL